MAVIAAGRKMRMDIEHSLATSATSFVEWMFSTTKRHGVEVLTGIADIIASEHYIG